MGDKKIQANAVDQHPKLKLSHGWTRVIAVFSSCNSCDSWLFFGCGCGRSKLSAFQSNRMIGPVARFFSEPFGPVRRLIL